MGPIFRRPPPPPGARHCGVIPCCKSLVGLPPPPWEGQREVKAATSTYISLPRNKKREREGWNNFPPVGSAQRSSFVVLEMEARENKTRENFFNSSQRDTFFLLCSALFFLFCGCTPHNPFPHCESGRETVRKTHFEPLSHPFLSPYLSHFPICTEPSSLSFLPAAIAVRSINGPSCCCWCCCCCHGGGCTFLAPKWHCSSKS